MRATVERDRTANALDTQSRLQAVAGRSGVEVADILAVLEKSAERGQGSFSPQERRVLVDAGIDLEGPETDPTGLVVDALGLSSIHTFASSALTVAEAATKLAVSSARIRQRIGDRSLASMRIDDAYRLPDWQFINGGAVPHLAPILDAAIELHPLALAGFMTRPNVDLTVENRPMSPVEWLISGGQPSTVAEFVGSLAHS